MTFQPEDRALQANRAIERATALTVACPYCHEPIGYPCVNQDTGRQIQFQAAHYWRIQEVRR